MTTKNYARSVRAKLLQGATNLPRSLDIYHTGTETIHGKIEVLRYRYYQALTFGGLLGDQGRLSYPRTISPEPIVLFSKIENRILIWN